jgi:hypothetical protein
VLEPSFSQLLMFRSSRSASSRARTSETVIGYILLEFSYRRANRGVLPKQGYPECRTNEDFKDFGWDERHLLKILSPSLSKLV